MENEQDNENIHEKTAIEGDVSGESSIERIASERALEAETLLNAIQEALDDNSACYGSFINEFGDFTMAIPLNGGQEALDRFMEKQKMEQSLEQLAQGLVSQIKTEGKHEISCCFTGRRPKKIQWLADENDERTQRLQDTLEFLIKSLTLNGVDGYIAGNAEGFDTIAAEMVIQCNGELSTMKEIGLLPDDWEAPELEIAIPFEGHNAQNERVKKVQSLATVAHVVSDAKSHTQAYFERNEYMVDHSDIVVALLEDDTPDSMTGGTARTIAYADEQGKPIVLFYARWFEDGWPCLGEGTLSPCVAVKDMDIPFIKG